jgi:UDP-3-O-[3-hydroxymyristoyl] N-acetylglucosamine deacetylase
MHTMDGFVNFPPGLSNTGLSNTGLSNAGLSDAVLSDAGLAANGTLAAGLSGPVRSGPVRADTGLSGANVGVLGSGLPGQPVAACRQRTLKTAIGCVGVGVHSGKRISLTIRPAPANQGIVFRRTDLGRQISARFDNVVSTHLCTVLGDPAMPSAQVGTVEHLLAALHALAIDNAVIDVDGPEVPILDGSAAPFVFLLDCAGSVEQDAARQVIEICRAVRVASGPAWAELRPFRSAVTAGQPVLEKPVFELDVSIEFAAAAIGRQSASLRLTPDNFRQEIAAARTFAQISEVNDLHAAGLARGGSLDNAIVVDGPTIMNPGGLRMENEFASHKLLDAVGDLALAGGALHGRFVAHRTGHELNNRLLRALFADALAWRAVASDPLVAAA